MARPVSRGYGKVTVCRFLGLGLLSAVGCTNPASEAPSIDDPVSAAEIAPIPQDAGPVQEEVSDAAPAEQASLTDPQPTDAVLAELRRLGARVDSLATAQGATLDQLQEEATSESQLPSGQPPIPPLGNLWTRVLWTLVVIVITALAIRSIAFVLDALAERNAERRLFYKRLVPLARLLFWVVAAVVIARGVWSIDAQGLLAAGAAGAVAIGFAAQDILKNVFGGLVIVADRPFAAGDKIRVGDTYGEVVSVGLWSTRITTPDDNLVSVPNSQVVNGQVANANSGALDCQVVTDLYLPGWVDERLAKKIAYESAASSPFVYLHKPIIVLVRDHFQDTFVTNLKVKAYVLDQRYEFRFMSDVTERARHEFRKHGLLGPFHGARPFFRVDQGGNGGSTVPDPFDPAHVAEDVG